jgi:hypothetical protein
VTALLGPSNPPGGWATETVGLIKPSLDAQGNAQPYNSFPNDQYLGNQLLKRWGIHEVVKVSGVNAVFDPSYGSHYQGETMAQAEQSWEDQSLDGWDYRYRQPQRQRGAEQVDAASKKSHQNGVSETSFAN